MNDNIEDIHPSQSKELISIISKLSLDERAVKFFNFWNFTRELQWAGIQMRNPSMSEAEIDASFKQMMRKHFEDNALND
jgi:hypothetical protein